MGGAEARTADEMEVFIPGAPTGLLPISNFDEQPRLLIVTGCNFFPSAERSLAGPTVPAFRRSVLDSSELHRVLAGSLALPLLLLTDLRAEKGLASDPRAILRLLDTHSLKDVEYFMLEVCDGLKKVPGTRDFPSILPAKGGRGRMPLWSPVDSRPAATSFLILAATSSVLILALKNASISLALSLNPVHNPDFVAESSNVTDEPSESCIEAAAKAAAVATAAQPSEVVFRGLIGGILSTVLSPGLRNVVLPVANGQQNSGRVPS